MNSRAKLFGAVLVVVALAPAGVTAQFGEDDSATKIKRIVENIAKEMAEIDRLLLQSGSPGQSGSEAAQAMARNVERINKLLEQTSESQTSVVRGIDELIEEIEKMGGQSMSGEPGEQRSGRQRQQRPGERERNRPMQDSSQERRRDDPQHQDQPERNEKDADDPGRNQLSDQRRDDPKEKVAPPTDAEGWGFLPKSLDFLKHRGGSPAVPERYRKFREAFLKQGVRNKDK